MARTGLRGTEANTQLDWLGRLDELLGPGNRSSVHQLGDK
jgi:hypothetical protein